MRQRLFLLLTLILFGFIDAFAQYSTKTGIPDRWEREGGPILVDDYNCNFFKDNATGELCAMTVSYYGNNKGNVKMPKTIKYKGKKYTLRIANFITQGVESVTIPSTVIALGTCSGAKQVLFEKGSELRIIQDGAFRNNNQLTSIDIPSSVDTIGENAFQGCKNLGTIKLPRYISVIKKYAFAGCENLQSVLWTEDLSKNGLISTAIVEKSLKRIDERTFYGCKSLQSIDFSGSLNNIEIGEGAFFDCKNLRSVTTAHGLIGAIGNCAFQNCTSLSTIKWSSGKDNEIDLGLVRTIGENAFRNCSAIKNVNFLYSETIKTGAFAGCTALQEASMHKLKRLEASAFNGCSALKKVYLSDSLCYIAAAFDGCKSLETLYGLDHWDNIEFENYIEGIFPTLTNDRRIKNIQMSYSYNARNYTKKGIEKWRKKKEYESNMQWKERVNEVTQSTKVAQLLDSAKVDYIKRKAPRDLKCTIESYDADEGVYKIQATNVNTYSQKNPDADRNKGLPSYNTLRAGAPVYIFAKVPVSEAPVFKENFKNVKIEPTYCIAKNYLGIATCKFILNGKTYTSPTLYDDETANVQIDLPPLEIDLGGGTNNSTAQRKPQIPIDNSLDMNIPSVNTANTNTFAVIIGNEKYSQVAQVPYAENDAKVFAEYCRKTLGLPSKNVRTYGNATYAGFVQAMNDIKDIAKAYKGDLSVLFYYAGHGIPNEASKDAYLLPVDADGKQMDVCYSVGKLYKELGALGAKNVVVFMDACFSGAQRGEGMLASARGVALKAKAEAPQGNMVVFSAATGDETAYPYKEKGHGMFTYFLLKKLRETKGDCTLGELGEYIQTNVRQQSVVVNRKSQTPTVVPSTSFANDWKNLKLR